MVNLEITGRMGVTTRVGCGDPENTVYVTFDDTLIYLDYADYHQREMRITIDELREIVARWDAGI